MTGLAAELSGARLWMKVATAAVVWVRGTCNYADTIVSTRLWLNLLAPFVDCVLFAPPLRERSQIHATCASTYIYFMACTQTLAHVRAICNDAGVEVLWRALNMHGEFSIYSFIIAITPNRLHHGKWKNSLMRINELLKSEWQGEKERRWQWQRVGDNFYVHFIFSVI